MLKVNDLREVKKYFRKFFY